MANRQQLLGRVIDGYWSKPVILETITIFSETNTMELKSKLVALRLDQLSKVKLVSPKSYQEESRK